MKPSSDIEISEVTFCIVFSPFLSPLMLYGPGLPQKLIGGWTDEVRLGSVPNFAADRDEFPLMIRSKL